MAEYQFVSTYKSSSSDRTYTVKRNKETGQLTCDCPAFLFQRKPVDQRSCKHTVEAQQLLPQPSGKILTEVQELLKKLAELKTPTPSTATHAQSETTTATAVEVPTPVTVEVVSDQEAVAGQAYCPSCRKTEELLTLYKGTEHERVVCKGCYAAELKEKRQREVFVVGRHSAEEWEDEDELFNLLEVHGARDEGQIVWPDQYEFNLPSPPAPVLFKLPSVDIFKRAIDGIATLVDEAEFQATLEGISFTMMDPSHVALIDLLIPRDACEKFDFDGEKRRFTFNIEDVQKVLKRKHKNDSVQIFVDGEDMEMALEDGRKRIFKQHLIESYSSPCPLPKLSFNAKLVLVYEDFMDILKDLETCADHITIAASKDDVVFSGKSDQGSVRNELSKRDMGLLELEVKEESKATFSIDYLSKILKAVPCGTVKVEYSSKLPMRMELALDEMGSKIDFYLAPRVEER